MRIRHPLLAIVAAAGLALCGAGLVSSSVQAGEEIGVGGISLGVDPEETAQPLCPPRPITPTGIFCDPRGEVLRVVAALDLVGLAGGPIAIADDPLTVAGQALCPPRPIDPPPNAIFCNR